MIFNTTNQYLVKIQVHVTMIPNFTNKEQLTGSMLVRGKSMEARQQQLMNDYWNDLSNDLHGVTKELEMNQIWQCYGVLSMKTALLSPT